MDLVNRYVYAVTKRFGQKQREEIERELRANIEEMLELKEEHLSYEERVTQVLNELGNPEVLAAAYIDTPRYIIGPQYYDLYMLVLKIVCGAVFGGISIALFVESAFVTDASVSHIASNYFNAVFSALLQAFAWTTLGFMIAERKGSGNKSGAVASSQWDLSKLPAVPEKKEIIAISEPIAAIIFTTIFYTIFIALMYSAPQLFGVFMHTDKMNVVIPVFDIDVLKGYRLVIIGVFILSIFSEMLKLYYRRWTLQHAIFHAVLGFVSTVLVILILSNVGIWNPEFASDINSQLKLNFDFTDMWSRIRNWIVVAVIFFGGLDVVLTLVKGFRYRGK